MSFAHCDVEHLQNLNVPSNKERVCKENAARTTATTIQVCGFGRDTEAVAVYNPCCWRTGQSTISSTGKQGQKWQRDEVQDLLGLLVSPKSLSSWQSGADIPTNQTISFSLDPTYKLALCGASLLRRNCQEDRLLGETSRSVDLARVGAGLQRRSSKNADPFLTRRLCVKDAYSSLNAKVFLTYIVRN